MPDVKEVAEYMKRHGLTLVTAESCTAGLIASRLAEVPGAGQLLDCAFVVYTPGAKQRCLGVSGETIERCNLTSEAVAREMANGAIERGDANVAIANTGVADDTDPDIPAGTQCFAWIFRGADGNLSVHTGTSRFEGDRNSIREQAADFALGRLPALHGGDRT
jgi:nicotinamide-nucleotide amidase